MPDLGLAQQGAGWVERKFSAKTQPDLTKDRPNWMSHLYFVDFSDFNEDGWQSALLFIDSPSSLVEFEAVLLDKLSKSRDGQPLGLSQGPFR